MESNVDGTSADFAATDLHAVEARLRGVRFLEDVEARLGKPDRIIGSGTQAGTSYVYDVSETMHVIVREQPDGGVSVSTASRHSPSPSMPFALRVFFVVFHLLVLLLTLALMFWGMMGADFGNTRNLPFAASMMAIIVGGMLLQLLLKWLKFQKWQVYFMLYLLLFICGFCVLLGRRL